ncbi:MAG: 4Fe-4S binding protein [Brevinema sp.]
MPHFIDDTCINCASCESVCPVTCISEGDSRRDIDETTCIDCDACVSVCPVSAIHVR